MKIKAKDLRKTILLGGMSVDEAAEWCEKSLCLCDSLDRDWFCSLIRLLMKFESRGVLEFSCCWDDCNEEGEDYLLYLLGDYDDELPTAFYPDEGNAEGAARDDCEVLNKFLEDFYG